MIKHAPLVIGEMLAKNESVGRAKVKAARLTVETDFSEDQCNCVSLPRL